MKHLINFVILIISSLSFSGNYPLLGYQANCLNLSPSDCLQQKLDDLGELRAQAEKTQENLKHFLVDFARDYRGSRTYIPDTKGLGTINALLQTRWEGDASKITDYARATISFPTLDMMYQALEDLKRSGLAILSIEDHFKNPCLGGYRDITLVFEDHSNGHLGEIQLNLNAIMDFKNGLGTDLFHVIREILAIPRLKDRELTEKEYACLEWLFAKEKEGYERALEKATGNVSH